jgi:hypothetical protein
MGISFAVAVFFGPAAAVDRVSWIRRGPVGRLCLAAPGRSGRPVVRGPGTAVGNPVGRQNSDTPERLGAFASGFPKPLRKRVPTCVKNPVAPNIRRLPY